MHPDVSSPFRQLTAARVHGPVSRVIRPNAVVLVHWVFDAS
jgi:hypothetical protein